MLILASRTVSNASSQEKDTPIYFPRWSLLHVSVHYFCQPRFIIQSASICFVTEEEKIIAKLCFLYSQEWIATAYRPVQTARGFVMFQMNAAAAL